MPVRIKPRTKNPSGDISYWRKREAIQAQRNRKNFQQYRKSIDSIYRRCLWECQKEIDYYFSEYAADEKISLADARARISKADARKWQEINEQFKQNPHSKEAKKAFKLVDATAQINRLELLKGRIGLQLIDSYEDIATFFDGTLSHEIVEEMKRQSGIFGEFVGENQAQRVKRIAYASFHSATWSERIWNHQDALRNKLNEILTNALIIGRNGKDPRFVKNLQDAFNVSKYNAERLLVTELARVQTDVQKDTFRRLGYEKYIFICNKIDGKTCEVCRELDGNVFLVKDMMPGENASPVHPGCRCSTSAYVD